MKNVYMICNAHIDITWLWRWNEGAAEALSTFRTAADFCEEFPGFVFNHNEAILYEWVEQYDPALFERIRKLVKEGKWNIMGGWYLQPDCIMVAGESFVRQIGYGRKYFLDKFGVMPSTAVNFDSFGHSYQLPQILRQTGYDSYLVCRAGEAQNLPKTDFIWQGPDGSEVYTHFSDENYNSVMGHADEELARWMERHKNQDTGLFLWGVGDHGGGPSREDIIKLRKFFDNHGATEFHMAGPEEYFAVMDRKELPVFKHSLGPVSRGCYTSCVRIKQRYRSLENELYETEKMCSQAAMQGLMQYPAESLMDARRAMMRAEFHDALPGSAIRPSEEDTLNLLGYGLTLTSQAKTDAFFALCAGQKKVTPGEVPILVYNPHPFPIDMVVDCELVLPRQNWNSTYMEPIVYQEGEKLPCQSEKTASTFEIDWRKRAVFRAHLEPTSMNRFDCRFVELPCKPPIRTILSGSTHVFDNGRLRSVLNLETGLLDSVSVDGRTILTRESMRLVVMHDIYNSWEVGYRSFDDEEGEFTLMPQEQAAEYCGLPDYSTPRVRIIEEGEVRTVTESIFSYGRSTARIRMIFPSEGTRIGVEIQTLWQEKDRMLKLCIPTTLKNSRYYGQTAFGREELKNDGTEVVSHQWSALCSKEQAVSLINEGIYGSSEKDGEIRITLLRSPGYSMSDCDDRIAMKPGIMIDRMDQGERSFRLWIDLGPKNEVMAGIDNRALISNEKPAAMSLCPSGQGKPFGEFMTIDAENIVVSALKEAEDGNGFVLRLFETEGKLTRAVIRIRTLDIEAEESFRPFEIRTFLVANGAKGLREIPMLEEEKFRFKKA